jgi:hypothetical protein
MDMSDALKLHILKSLQNKRNEIQLVQHLAHEMHLAHTLPLLSSPQPLSLSLSTENFPRTFYFYTNGQKGHV